jgi:hypothetical protein
LATAWLLGALPSFALVVVRTMSHAWNQDVQYVWEWFVPALFPTLSLVITSMAAAAFEPTAPAKELQPRAFFFRLTLGVSALYLIVTAHREARFSDRRGLEVGPRVASG